MESVKAYHHLDLDWMKELALHGRGESNTIAVSFIKHLPSMIEDILEAAQLHDSAQLAHRIRKINSVASMFTLKDYSKNFKVQSDISGERLSIYTLEQVNEIIENVQLLRAEVSSYIYSRESYPKHL